MKAAELTSAEINAIMFAFRRTDGFVVIKRAGARILLRTFRQTS